MILKGNQRAGACDLATHLLNAADNEQIEIAQITGAIADDLHGALAEFEAVAVGTMCKLPLYSLSINPSAPINREQYMAAIDRIEKRLGLAGQPRAIIFHVKQGTRREHCHVVWSRIDTANMRAVQLSHDHMKLRTLAREIAHEYGLELPPGLAEDREMDRLDTPEQTLAEKAQAEQTAISPDERRADIMAAYAGAGSAEAFVQALERCGYFIARGERRALVVVDRYGHVHSLARQIRGVKARSLKAFLAEIEVHTLDEAKRLALSMGQAAEDRRREMIQARLADALAALDQDQALRRLALTQQMAPLFAQHALESAALLAAQDSEALRPVARVISAVLALFARIPSLRSVLAYIHRIPLLSLAERHRLENDALARRHARENRNIERRRQDIRKIEKRERLAVAKVLLRSIRATDHKLEMFAVNAGDITARSLFASGDDEPMSCDPEEAELDRMYALMETGLTPPFNASARAGRRRPSGDHESLTPYGFQPFP